MVTQQDMPFSLRMHNRSPREILEKKAEMKREDKAGVEDVEEKEDVDKMVVEGEIRVKLFYLGMIHRLREGGGAY